MGLMSPNFSMQHQMPPCNYNSLANRPYITNSQNPSAPPTYTCGKCLKEINDNDEALFCESSCKFFYHRFVFGINWIHFRPINIYQMKLIQFSICRICVGLTEADFQRFIKDVNTEWKCPKCLDQAALSPAIKLKSWNQTQSLSRRLSQMIISFVFSQQFLCF